jgi:carboxylesterase type B
MNIYVPERLEKSVASAPMPALVLIHGSEYGWGAGNAINGSILAASGQIVVVTVNYRLDVYGKQSFAQKLILICYI